MSGALKRSRIDAFIETEEGLQLTSRKAFEAWQLSKLNSLLSHCKQRSAYYSYLPDSVSSFDSFARIRLSNSAELSAFSNRMLLSSQASIEKIITQDTSATAGPGKRLFYSREDLGRTVRFFACGLGEMVAAGGKTAILMPGPGENGLASLIGNALALLGSDFIILDPAGSWAGMLSALQAYEATGIVAMPCQLLSILRASRISGISLPLKAALLSADTCGPKILEYIGAEQCLDVFPHYGSRESGLGGAITCPAHEGMHVWENELYVEVLGEDGRPLPDGETGELVITAFQRMAMPLVRYRSGDRGRMLPGVCPCGSFIKRIDSVGRIWQGTFNIDALNEAVFAEPNVLDFEAYDIKGSLRLRVAAIGDISREAIAERVGKGCEIEVFRMDLATARPFYAAKRHVKQ